MKQTTLILAFLIMIVCAVHSSVCRAQPRWTAGDYSIDTIHSTETISDQMYAEAGHTTTPSTYVDTSGGTATATSYMKYKRTFTLVTYPGMPYIEGFMAHPTGNIYGHVSYNDSGSTMASSSVVPAGGSNGYNLTGVTNFEPEITTYHGDTTNIWTGYQVATNGAYTASTTIECDASASGNAAHAQANGTVDIMQ